MKFAQIPLNFWKNEYQNEWIVGASNEVATRILMNSADQILLSGPRFCGKKHITSKVGKITDCAIFFVECMQDIEIIAKYDYINTTKQKAIWVLKEREFVKDVQSRFNMMHKAQIFELTEDMIFPLLHQRFAHLGFEVKNDFINFCIYNIPRTYQAVQDCAEYLKQINEASPRKFREFFAQKFR